MGASLQADYEALKNDLEQATDLAADFQRQLAGKSNEVAHFKNLVERMQTDLNRLENHVKQLREERHRLANEVMRADAYDLEARKLRAENARLHAELDILRKLTAVELGETNQQKRHEIEQMRAAILKLSRQNSTNVPGSELRAKVDELSATIRRLEERLENQSPRSSAGGLAAGSGMSGSRPADDDFDVINISFNT